MDEPTEGCPHGMSSALWCEKCQAKLRKAATKDRHGVAPRIRRTAPDEGINAGTKLEAATSVTPADRASVSNTGKPNPYRAFLHTDRISVVPSKWDTRCKRCSRSVAKDDPVFCMNYRVEEISPDGDVSHKWEKVWVCSHCFTSEGGTYSVRAQPVVNEALD